MQTGKVYSIDNAHKGKITDMSVATINESKIILSSSRDGSIKVWNIN